MRRFAATFTGRRINAGGLTYPIRTTAAGTDEDGARLHLYERYEHISDLQLRELPESLYAACVALGIETNNHESDLYIESNEFTRDLVALYGRTAESFRDSVTGKPSLDIPFAFLPWWEARQAKK